MPDEGEQDRIVRGPVEQQALLQNPFPPGTALLRDLRQAVFEEFIPRELKNAS